ncbi:MAG: HD-GYP domain-containing protein [Rubrivivax sp.]|nr:HD-GYP domain-containing protein [Rubrivivax sp.]
MSKKISISQVRLGMHLLKLEGAWIHHPFWKTRFVIDSPDDLRRLQGSGVAECWIDPALGLDVAPRPDATPTASLAMAEAGPTGPVAPAPPAACSLSAELKEAAAICRRGREAVEAMFGEARLGRAVDAESFLPLVQEISDSVARHGGALISLARLKTKDAYTYMHSVAVCALMVSLARQLGMDEAECRLAGAAGLMHDVGKALMPLEVLNKPGRLTEAEFAIIRSHPVRGHALLVQGKGATAETLDVVLHHHERFDGKGYPFGLSEDRLSRFARMGAVCDVYDAITSNRPYKAGWDPAESMTQMASWKGHFDPGILAAFVQSLGIYPVGSLVRLQSGRMAVVVEQNPGQLTAPQVKVFFSTQSQLHIAPELLDLSHSSCTDRIVARGGADRDKYKHIDELWVDPETLRRSRS